MITKKNITAFLFFLFAFLSISGFANSTDARPVYTKHTEATNGGISQPLHNADNPSIVTIEGLLQTPIKINESNYPAFQNLKNSKKVFNLNFSLQSFLFAKSCYASYCSIRINSIHFSPFYIAYHRLLI